LWETGRKDFSENQTAMDCSDHDLWFRKAWKDRGNGSYEEDLQSITIWIKPDRLREFQRVLIREGLEK
jgi:hypothetical protein